MKRLYRLIFLCILGVDLMAAVPCVQATDEFIWRDRWNQMGAEFQQGYIIGVEDLVQALLWDTVRDTLKVDGKTNHLQSSLRSAHLCANKFSTIKSAVEFAATAMSKQTDPQIEAAFVIYSALTRCDSDWKAKKTGGVTAFVWKDRWDRYINNDVYTGNKSMYSNFFIDGYVAGILDLIRNIDNSAKTNTVLRRDIIDAEGCDTKIGNGKTIDMDQLLTVVNKTIHKGEDPTESMAMAILDALRVCKR